MALLAAVLAEGLSHQAAVQVDLDPEATYH